jgi:C-terminal processing protease CtpA/Prc
VLQHFFSFFDVIDTDWEQVLGETLKSALADKRKKDFFVTLSRMFAQLDDGHGIVFGEQMYHLSIRTELIENRIVVTASKAAGVETGDIIEKIDGKPVMKVLNETERIISGSPQLRRHIALNILGSKFDAGETDLVIVRDGKKQNVTVKNFGGNMFYNPVNEHKYLYEKIVEVEPGIYYINMTNCTDTDFDREIDILAHAKAVIYDCRGGSKLNFFHILPYLIEEPVNSAWWNIPQTFLPDRKRVEFSKSNWSVQPKQPLFTSKSIIINVPSVVSSGETMMGIIDRYKLATTVGEPTAGCNGNINPITLPCGYSAWWTGMQVLKHDGSQLYLKGFQPDYPVNKTIRAIMEGRDEYLEKALEIAGGE